MNRFTQVLPLLTLAGLCALVQFFDVEFHWGQIWGFATNAIVGAVVLLVASAVVDVACIETPKQSIRLLTTLLAWIAVPYYLVVTFGVILQSVAQAKFGAGAASYHPLAVAWP